MQLDWRKSRSRGHSIRALLASLLFYFTGIVFTGKSGELSPLRLAPRPKVIAPPSIDRPSFATARMVASDAAGIQWTHKVHPIDAHHELWNFPRSRAWLESQLDVVSRQVDAKGWSVKTLLAGQYDALRPPIQRKEMPQHDRIKAHLLHLSATQFSPEYGRNIARAIVHRLIRAEPLKGILLVDWDMYQTLQEQARRCDDEIRATQNHEGADRLARLVTHTRAILIAYNIGYNFFSHSPRFRHPRIYPSHWAESSDLIGPSDHLSQHGGIQDRKRRPPGGTAFYRGLLGSQIHSCSEPKVLHPFLAVSPFRGFEDEDSFVVQREERLKQDARRGQDRQQRSSTPDSSPRGRLTSIFFRQRRRQDETQLNGQHKETDLKSG